MFSKNKLLEKHLKFSITTFSFLSPEQKVMKKKNENTEICNLGVKFMENILPFF